MLKQWRARLVFEVAASDIAMAHNQAFGVLIDACRLARHEGVGVISRPAYNLDNPNLYNPFLARFRVAYPPPLDLGEKAMHRVDVDVEYVKVDADWDSVGAARQWLLGLVRRSQTGEVYLTAVEDSPVHWN
jgi:hypothetical protein